MLHTRNNTDGNELVIFSGIALYYGDNYIFFDGTCLPQHAARKHSGNKAMLSKAVGLVYV